VGTVKKLIQTTMKTITNCILISTLFFTLGNFSTSCKKESEELIVVSGWLDGLKGKILYTSEDGNGNYATIYVIDSLGIRWINPAIKDLYDIKWSPDGSEFVYSSQGDIYTMNSDGSDKKMILEHKTYEYLDPCWSPDGNRIAFTAIGDPMSYPFYNVIYIMNHDGTGVTNLVHGCSPAWSHDGRKIIFQRDSLTCSVNISDHLVNKLTDIHTYRSEMTISPDETRVLYNQYNSTCTNINIFIENLDGSGRQQLTNSINAGEYNHSPCWSTDGTKIAFGWKQYLCIMNVDGSSKILVSEVPASGVRYVDWY
jgi:Tol biopolymer transport system component